MKSGAERGEDSFKKSEYKGGPLSFESTKAVYFQNKESLGKIFSNRKINLFEASVDDNNLLDERNIKEDLTES
jgi:hypothetical protein